MTAGLEGVFPQIHSAIEAGTMLDAWNLAEETGVPLQDWPEGEPLCQAARLAHALGAPRLSMALHWKNWRALRSDPRRYNYALRSRLRHTPAIKLLWESREFLNAAKEIPDEEHADLLAFQASVLVMLADFSEAETLLARAIALAPRSSWLRTERSRCYSAADRYDEALAEAREAVELSPSYWPAIARCSSALVHLGRDAEALHLLEHAHSVSQHASHAIEMQAMHSEREDPEKGLWCLAEIERLSPLMEPSFQEWLANRRADFALMAGQVDQFLEAVDETSGKFRKEVAANLKKSASDGKVRKRLEVKFTRQHRMTCAPATLASIAAYWGVARDHLEIAEAICYDGTPWHKERRWADENGFTTKEFRLNHDNLVALIDKGIPFTLTTQWTTGAHLQACIGYDTGKGTVILRDPTERHYGERLLSELLASHPVGGPRAMVMVPADKRGLLEGLLLEDEHVYDSLHRLFVALETNDRFKILAAVSELRAVAPDHPVALDGELRAAQKFGEWQKALGIAEQLIARFPKHEPLWLTKCTLLLNLRRTKEHRAYLEGIVSQRSADPVFQSDLGELLTDDARELQMAEYHLRSALRSRGNEARVYENLARCRMKQRRFDEAADLRRAASCLAISFEPYAANYFETCRIIRRTPEALAYLESRVKSLGTKDCGPLLTHARMLESIHRTEQAAEVLERALAFHPDDGELLLRGGHLMVSWGPGFRERGLEWMERSKGRCAESMWLRESAEAATFVGDRANAIRHWTALLNSHPFDISIWRSLAWLTAEQKGRNEALELIEKGTSRYPAFAELWGVLAEWLATESRGPIPALDRYLELMPSSAWGYRERALRKVDRNQFEEALADAREALALEPENSVSLHIHGRVLAKLHRKEEAADAFRMALAMDVDRTGAATDLMDLAMDRDESTASIAFIKNEMTRQVSNGEIVLVFQQIAWRWVDPAELLETLQGFCVERPDLWQTWSARITQGLRMSQHADALEAATSMTGTFPLMPRAWIDLAKVHQATGEIAKEVAATGKALEISPAWDEAARVHADALERAGELAKAETVLRNAVATDPLNPANRGCLADLLRRMGRNREAVDLLLATLRDSPFYRWGWSELSYWVKQDDRVAEAVALLESVSESQSHRRAWWSQAADAWMDLDRPADAIQAARQGLLEDPDNIALREKLAGILCESGEVDEALALCEPPSGAERPSRALEGRRASILMRSGQPVAAIEAMRKLLDVEPDYIWGLAELTNWLSTRKDWTGTLEVAGRWSRHSPLDHVALGFIGQAEEQLEHPEAAAKAYARALVLMPDYEFAGRRLLNIQIKAKRYPEAAETLGRLRHYSPSIWLECDALELELKRTNFDEALVQAGKILDRPDAGFNVVDWVDKRFTEAQRAISWRNLLEERLRAGTAVAPGALAVSIGQITTNVFVRNAYKKIKAQPKGSPLRIEGWKRMIDLAAKLNEGDAVATWASKDREELRGDAGLWNEMGGAFLTLCDYKRGVGWTWDWKERSTGVTADTLTWIAALHDGCGKNEVSKRGAQEARMEGLRRFPNWQSSSIFRSGLAFRAAVDGDIDEAKAWMLNFEPTTIPSYYVNYGKLAQALIAAADGDEALARTKLSEALAFFAGVNEAGAKWIAQQALEAAAQRIGWARGSARRLRRKWQLPALGKVTPKPPKAGQRNKPVISAWTVVVIFIFVSSLLRTCASL